MKLYHWFIPNKKNNFHPHVLRTSGLIIFLIIFALLPLTYNVTAARQLRVLGYATSISVSDLNTLSNQERSDAGLAPLNLNNQLNNAASVKASDMFADDYWSHVAPDGTTPWSFIVATGYSYSEAGENLAKNFNTSGGVVNGWMNSPTHAANVLKSSYTDVGYAVINGTLSGEETTLVVAMYGMRAIQNNQPAVNPVQTETQATVDSTNDQTKTTVTDVIKSPQQTTQNTPALTDDTGVVEGSVSSPLKVYSSLNWAQKASILLLCTMILLFIMKHTLIWREQRRGLRHIWLRAHPIGQTVILIIALMITITSGAGVVL